MDDLKRRFGQDGRQEEEGKEEEEEEEEEGEEDGGEGNSDNEAGASSPACFYCRKEGHWYRDCPERRRHRHDEKQQPQAPCSMCGQPCDVKTSRTARNPNRLFYSCPSQPQCPGWIGWCDGEQ
jgi:hypothetical protein